MMRIKNILAIGFFCVVGTLVGAGEAWACPSCYGAADGPMIQGMNMAILTMLGITGCVLGAISTFFLMMRRRMKQLRSTSATGGIEPYVNEQGILQWNNS